MAKLVKQQAADRRGGVLRRHAFAREARRSCFDADDTTLWTYDMEVGDMHFNFNPAEQDVWVQDAAVPGHAGHGRPRQRRRPDAGCTVVGLTGRNDDQKARDPRQSGEGRATPASRRANYFTKWTGVGASPAAVVHHLRDSEVHDDRVQVADARARRIESRRRLRHRRQLRRPVQRPDRRLTPTAPSSCRTRPTTCPDRIRLTDTRSPSGECRRGSASWCA